MRICLLGRTPDGLADEGMKNVLRHFADGLSARHEIRILDPQDVPRRSFWSALNAFQPEIIHYLAGPTLASLMLVRFLKARTSAKTVITAIHPWFPLGSSLGIGAFRPDMVLAASRRTASMFAKHHVRVSCHPFGVDTSRFHPVNADRKTEWRREFGLPADRYLILHVGHLVRRRGLDTLGYLPTSGRQVLVVGSVNTPADSRLQRDLEDRGVIVWTRYVPDIERVFALADCYLFPTQESLGAIEIPLSVLEAMACNLPILARPFGGLPDLFPPDEDMVYEDQPDHWPACIDALERRRGSENRQKVLPLDWTTVVASLEENYRRLWDNPER